MGDRRAAYFKLSKRSYQSAAVQDRQKHFTHVTATTHKSARREWQGKSDTCVC